MTSSISSPTSPASTAITFPTSDVSTLMTSLSSTLSSSPFSTTVVNSISSTPSPSSAPLTSVTSTPLTTFLIKTSKAMINSTLTISSLSSSMTFQTTSHGLSDDNVSATSTNYSSVSEEDRRRYLDYLQDDTITKLTPAIIFLALIAVIGLCGNCIVLLVYARRPRRSATDIFIMAIAAFDLMTNVLAIPGEIYDAFHYWDIDDISVCRIRLYLNAFGTITSALVLLAVAVSRYKKICRPFGNQTSIKTAKIVAGLITFAGGIIAVPQTILYGIHTKATPRADIFGQECSTSDKFKDTIWPLIYTGFLMLLFISICTPLIVLYVLIGIQAWRHSQRSGSVAVRSKSRSKTPPTSEGTVSCGIDSEESTDKKGNSFRGLSIMKRKRKKSQMGTQELNTVKTMDKDDVSELNILKTKEQIEEQLKIRDNNIGINAINEEDSNYNTKMMRSPTKDSCHVNVPMLQELNFKLDKIKNNDKDRPNENANSKDINETSQELEGKSDNCQKEDSDSKALTEFAACMQWVDITYCLDEENKTQGKDDITDGSGNASKKTSLSRKVSRENSLHQKLSDTLTRAKKARKQSSIAKESNKNEDKSQSKVKINNGKNKNEENSPSQVKTSNGENKNDLNNRITFDETVIETNEHTIKERELKSCQISQSDSTQNGTIESKLPMPIAKKKIPKRRVLTRTTLMLIIISAVYIIGFVPHLVVMSLRFTIDGFLENMSALGYAVYNIFLRFYFINSAANAIIYSLCDIRFREQVAKIMCCRK